MFKIFLAVDYLCLSMLSSNVLTSKISFELKFDDWKVFNIISKVVVIGTEVLISIILIYIIKRQYRKEVLPKRDRNFLEFLIDLSSRKISINHLEIIFMLSKENFVNVQIYNFTEIRDEILIINILTKTKLLNFEFDSEVKTETEIVSMLMNGKVEELIEGLTVNNLKVVKLKDSTVRHTSTYDV